MGDADDYIEQKQCFSIALWKKYLAEVRLLRKAEKKARKIMRRWTR